MSTNKENKVIISLLTWNGVHYLPWLINSLKAQTFKDWTLLVLDNASTDDSVKAVEDALPGTRIVRQKQNIGFARGHNLIMNWTESDYVFVLNQDIILDKDYIQSLVDFMDKNPMCASVSGKLMYWDFSEGHKTEIIDSAGLKIDRKRFVYDYLQGQADRPLENTEVFGLSATAVIYRRKALESVAQTKEENYFEFFDEDFFAYKEDVDLAWRLRLAGWQNWLITNTKAYHHRSVSGGSNIRFMFKHRTLANRLSYRNHLMTLYKNSFFKNIWQDFWPISWYEFRKFIYLLIFERQTLGGLSEFFRSLPKLKKKHKFIMSHTELKPADMRKWFR
ncbi:MAG: hypothetical protein C3F02_04660 [Parcubacteria group bacterium]|nr:MAG: hypothetical protein C3F02_04660 [Parcubacteria group bacterium]